MLERLRPILREECALSPGRPILAGISGGPDSSCLLDVLARLGYPLIVAHLNHGLRPEAEAEAETVRLAAERLQASFVLGREDIPAFAQAQGRSLEEAARISRYRFLFAEAERAGAQAVAVGHTADDQVETVLMHLLRGSGPSGLSGMAFRSLPTPWSRSIPLVRPLLGVWRREVLDYLAGRNIQPSFDPSNLDPRFYRNRLRHELIPILETYNPQVRERLLRTARVLSEEEAFMESLAETALEACVLERGPGFVAFDPEALRAQPLALQRRLLRRAAGELRPDLRDFDFAAVERALAFLRTPSRSGGCDLAAGLRLFLEKDRLWLAAWESDLPSAGWPQLPRAAEFFLDAPGRLDLPAGWVLDAGLSLSPPVPETAFGGADPYQTWLDAGRLQLPLRVRARRPGDRFCPLGLDGHSLKLSDYLIDVKLPRRARDRWPLLLSGETIAWVPGFRPAHPFRVTPQTRQLLHLRLNH